MAQGVSLALPILYETLMLRPAQLVALTGQPRRRAVGVVGATLEHQNIDALRGQLPRYQGCAQSSSDNHYATVRQTLRHFLIPTHVKSMMDLGRFASGYGLPR